MPAPNPMGGGNLESPKPEISPENEGLEVIDKKPEAIAGKELKRQSDAIKSKLETAPTTEMGKATEESIPENSNRDEKHKKTINNLLVLLGREKNKDVATEKFEHTYKRMLKIGYSSQNLDDYHDRFLEIFNGSEK